MNLSTSRTLKDAIETLREMKKTYTDIYFDVSCYTISALFGVSAEKIKKEVLSA